MFKAVELNAKVYIPPWFLRENGKCTDTRTDGKKILYTGENRGERRLKTSSYTIYQGTLYSQNFSGLFLEFGGAFIS